MLHRVRGAAGRAAGRLAILGLALLGLAGGGAAGAPRAQSPARLRAVILPHLSYGVFYIAEDRGLFAAQRLEVEFHHLERSTGALPLLIRGELDVLPLSPAPAVFNAISQGGRVRIVAGQLRLTTEGCASTGLMVRNGVEAQAGSRGLRVSANRSLLAGYVLEQLLRARGLDPAAQVFVDLTSPAEVAALIGGGLDLAPMGDPWRLKAEESGAARMVLATRDVLPNLQHSVVLFGPRLLDRDRDLGARFMVAYLQALAAYNEGATPRNVAALARAIELEPDALARCCWPPLPPDGRIEVPSLMAYQRWEVQRGTQDRVVAPEEFWDGAFVEQAAARLASASR